MAKKTKDKKEEKLEIQLWKSADNLRKNIDAAEYKHIVLGLIFLKYITDAFEELHTKLEEVLVDCISNLLLNTQIPSSFWYMSRNRRNGKLRDRTKEILFIDSWNMGHLINRRQANLEVNRLIIGLII